MQTINKKAAIIIITTLIVALGIFWLIKSTKNSGSSGGSRSGEQTLEDRGVEAKNTTSLFTFINPYSKDGSIEYLAPANDSIEANVNTPLSENALYVKTYDPSSGKISASSIKIQKPIKVVWGKDGSIVYLSSEGKAYLYTKDRANEIKLASSVTDVSLSDRSGLLSITSGGRISIFKIEKPQSALLTFDADRTLNSSVAGDDFVIFSSNGTWNVANITKKTKKALGATGSKVGQYSFGKQILLSSDESSSIYDYTKETRVTLDMPVDPAILGLGDNGIVFAGIRPGQSEDETTLFCINNGSGEIKTIYEPSSNSDVFNASSGVLLGNKFYFSWAEQLNVLKIDQSKIEQCTK